MLQFLWNQIAYLGTNYTKDSLEHKYIILINGLTLFTCIFNVSVVSISSFFIFTYWLIIPVLYTILFPLVFYFHKKGKLLLARIYFISLTLIYLSVYSILEGNQADAHFFFLLIASASFFSFPKREIKWLKFSIFLAFICFVCFEIFHSQIPTQLPFPAELKEFRAKFVHIGYATLFLIFGVYIYSTFQKAETLARIEHQKSEQLLQNILPIPVIQKLRENPEIIAEKFEECTVLFCDIVGFTEISRTMSATKLVSILNEIFSTFDDLAEKYQLEKIKTIGDAYMVVGGLPNPQLDHASRVAFFALEILNTVESYKSKYNFPLQIRIGIHTGEAVAGVIGKKKFIYDIWGTTVNTASRMESHGVAGEIQVSEQTYYKLKDNFFFLERGNLEVKGIGKIKTYLLKDKIVIS